MNRFIEKRGECYALQSKEIIHTITGAQKGNSFQPWLAEMLGDIKGALQLANCIALTPDTDNEPLYQKLDRRSNEWVTIGKREFDMLYFAEPRRVTPRTYGPTLRQFFKGGGKFQLTVDPRAEKAPEPKSKDRKQIEELLETHEPEITRYEISYKSTVPELTVAFVPKDRDIFGTAPNVVTDATDQFRDPSRPVLNKEWAIVDEAHHGADPITAALGSMYGPVKKKRIVFSDEKAPDRTDKYLEVCGRGKRHRGSDISVTLNLRTFKTNERGRPLACMICGSHTCWALLDAQKEWEKFHAEPEPVKPEQLDSKACRQFVEQLLAFDDLEKNRVLDIDRLLVSLLSSNQIGLLSYVLFLEGYLK